MSLIGFLGKSTYVKHIDNRQAGKDEYTEVTTIRKLVSEKTSHFLVLNFHLNSFRRLPNEVQAEGKLLRPKAVWRPGALLSS